MSINTDWVHESLAKAQAKIAAEVDRLDGGIPYIPTNGKYTDVGARDIAWWTNGFFAGLLWQLAHYTEDKKFSDAAEKIEERLDEALSDFVGLHHDVGFMWLHTSVANYRKTGSARSLQRGLHAAAILSSRYNEAGQWLRAWNGNDTGLVIIDSMMNIPLLYWASQELNDTRYDSIARLHADTISKYHVRADGSVGHIGSFDPDNGEFIEILGGQGYAADSSWSRGQAWAIYGFALSYHHTKDEYYLNTAKRVANYFIANVGATDWIPLVDFKAPAEPVIYDTSAGLIAACGLLEIAEHVNERERPTFYNAAVNIIQSTEKKYANWDNDVDSIIDGGTEAYHTVETRGVPLVYSDYYYVEALLRLIDKDLFIW
ncbi:MAG: glycoside hydrolase family 88 protein [Clostridiales Family XIII bacterium]|jgi:unsaturated chondroitin disaccharide hydrolase|nr:glycoside hydrolase family 88 protein [Clostridiales Family XIII bacterium]